MSWKVLITARTLNVDAVGRRALELLQQAGCELIHPPKYGLTWYASCGSCFN